LGENLTAIIDRKRFGARCADVDAEIDAHNVALVGINFDKAATIVAPPVRGCMPLRRRSVFGRVSASRKTSTARG
jgi:hypothetical protein